MGPQRVLIVGVSTRAFAESASAAGYACLSVDAFGDLDQKARIQNLALTRDLGRSYSAPAAVAAARDLTAESAAYVGNLENHPAAVRRLAVGRRLLGNSAAALQRSRDFAELASVVRAAGGRVPSTLTPGEAHNLPSGRSWLRKPMRGGGGSGIGDYSPGERLRRGDVVQERIDGVAASVSFAADGRRAVVLGVARGLVGDPGFGAHDYRYCGSLYPLSVEARVGARLEALAQATTAAFGLVGVNGIDVVVRDGQVFVLELNPRYSASMELIERGGALNVFETHVAACGGVLAKTIGAPRDVLGKAVLWARRDIVIGNTRGWLSRDDVRDIPHPGERIRRGHPICTVFARGRDDAACYGELAAGVAAIEQELGLLTKSTTAAAPPR